MRRGIVFSQEIGLTHLRDKNKSFQWVTDLFACLWITCEHGLGLFGPLRRLSSDIIFWN